MFISLFNTLKATGVPCSLRELLDLIAAVDKRLAFANMNEFYFLSRAILVKDEKHYDKFDRAFDIYFKGIESIDDILEMLIPDEWLKAEFEKHLTEAPGAFEIPFIIEKYIKKYDGVIALGCIIKGETNNFELISQSITDALINLSIRHKKPVGNGIITCFNDKQASDRKKKGAEAAAAVVNFFNGLTPFKLD